MSCVRCDIHPPEKTTYTYLQKDAKQPDENPNPLICGKKGCVRSGLVWLNQFEAADYYGKGERIFSARTSKESGLQCSAMAKIRVK